MIKPCAGEAGEGVYYTCNTGLVIHNYECVDGIMIHFLSGFHYLCIFSDCLGVAGHNFRYLGFKERSAQPLHRATDVAICDDAEKPPP